MNERRVSFKGLREALHRLLVEAAVQFPESGGDLDKWEWVRVTEMVVFEACKRKDLPPEKIIHLSKRTVRRILEREKAENILRQEFKPIESILKEERNDN